jgi:hypothetical protein
VHGVEVTTRNYIAHKDKAGSVKAIGQRTVGVKGTYAIAHKRIKRTERADDVRYNRVDANFDGETVGANEV